MDLDKLGDQVGRLDEYARLCQKYRQVLEEHGIPLDAMPAQPKVFMCLCMCVCACIYISACVMYVWRVEWGGV